MPNSKSLAKQKMPFPGVVLVQNHYYWSVLDLFFRNSKNPKHSNSNDGKQQFPTNLNIFFFSE